jgi:hypothetical protein
MTTTREQKRIANFKHIIDNLIDDDLCGECLESLGIKSADSIMRTSPKHLRSATYKDESGTTKAIPVGLVNETLAFKAYVKFKNSSADISERILGNYDKVTADDLDNVKRQVIFHSSSGDFQYDPEPRKMMPVDRGWAKSERAQNVEEAFDSIYVQRISKIPNSLRNGNLKQSRTRKKYYAMLRHAADRRAENSGIKEESAENNSLNVHENDPSNADTSHRSGEVPNKKVAAIDEIVFDTPIIIVDGCHASAISSRDEKSRNKDGFAENNSPNVNENDSLNADTSHRSADRRDENSGNKEEFAKNNSSLNVDEKFVDNNHSSNADLSRRDGEGPNKKEAAIIVEGYIDGLDVLTLHPNTAHANELATLTDCWDLLPIDYWDTCDDEIVFDIPTFEEKDSSDAELPSINQVEKETQERGARDVSSDASVVRFDKEDSLDAKPSSKETRAYEVPNNASVVPFNTSEVANQQQTPKMVGPIEKTPWNGEFAKGDLPRMDLPPKHRVRKKDPLRTKRGTTMSEAGKKVSPCKHQVHEKQGDCCSKKQVAALFLEIEKSDTAAVKSTNLCPDDIFDGENDMEFVKTIMQDNICKAVQDASDWETTNSGIKDVSKLQLVHEEIMSVNEETTLLGHGETLREKTMSAHGETAWVLGEVTETNELTTHGETMSVPQLHPSDLLGQTPLVKEHTHGCTDKWETGIVIADPLTMIIADDPVMCAIYPEDKDLLSKAGWKQSKGMVKEGKKMLQQVHQAKLRSFRLALSKPGWKQSKGMVKEGKKTLQQAHQAKLRSFQLAPMYQSMMFLMNEQEDGQRFLAKIAEAVKHAKEPPLTHGETVPGETTPVYLMNKQEDGQRFRAWIVEAIQQHENEPAKEPKPHKFRILRKLRVPVNGDQYKEIWILKFMKQNQNDKEQRSVGHQGPFCFSDHSCNGSCWSAMMECETRMVQAELLLIMINPMSSMKIIRYYHIGSETNPSDVLSKHWWHSQVWPLLQCVLFWKGNTADLLGVQEE